MADTADYLTKYKKFFEDFAATVNPDDQLPVKVAGYYLCDSELVGEIVDWTLQYLNQKNCPPSLVAPLTRIVIEEIKSACKIHPTACGYKSQDNVYQPLKLMQVVTGKVNEVCLRYGDNGRMTTLPAPIPGPPTSTCAIKNTRRRMEDRHVIIEDFHAVFGIKDQTPASYYAVFDGHAGTDAAIYSVSHLHQFLAESSYYPTDPVNALKEAFVKTDSLFIEKSNRENLRSGTTAVCALLRPKEKMLYVAWLGDSQALLVHEGHAVQVVNPHKPDRQDERERIEEMGGCVMYWGTWRVNGQLAVSRAIGDLDYKPYVTADADVKAVALTGSEDFLLLACDGLWDFVTEQEAVVAVYQQVKENPGDLEAVSQRLVQLSKTQGSTDNISVIVVFLTDPEQLASRPVVDVPGQWASLSNSTIAMESTTDSSNTTTATNPFTNGTYQKSGLLLDLGNSDLGAFKQNGSAADLFFLERPSNGKGLDDFGPETDVDSVDDAPLSPNNNAIDDADLELQRQQTSEFDPVREPRDETPTPPADEVPGVAGLVPENVAESGEDSEDEWNYYRVEPTGTPNPATDAEQLQQANPLVCQKPASLPAEEVPSDADNMESQLNPNAAEFVPSPTQTMPSMEEFLLSQSPVKGVSMDGIVVPSNVEFQDEVCQRPGDLDVNDSFSAAKLPDLINGQESEHGLGKVTVDSTHTENDIVDAAIELIGNVAELNDCADQQNSFKGSSGHLFDESEVSSTKAEFGDESTTSFMTSGSDFDKLQKSIGGSANSLSTLECSLIEQEISATHTMPTLMECKKFVDYDFTSEPEAFPADAAPREVKSPMHISFQLQKELAPEMESTPERVQVDSDDLSAPFELHETIMEASTDDPFMLESSASSVHEESRVSPVPLSPLDRSPNELQNVTLFPEFESFLKESHSPTLETVSRLPNMPPSLEDVSPINDGQPPCPSETQSSVSELSPPPKGSQLPNQEYTFSPTEISLENSKSPLLVEESLSPTLPLDFQCDIPAALRVCVYPESMMGPHEVVEMDKQSEEHDHEEAISPGYEKLVEENEVLINPLAVESSYMESAEPVTPELLDVAEYQTFENIITETTQEGENIFIEVQKAELETSQDDIQTFTQTPPTTPALAVETADSSLPDIVQDPQNLADAVEKLVEEKPPNLTDAIEKLTEDIPQNLANTVEKPTEDIPVDTIEKVSEEMQQNLIDSVQGIENLTLKATEVDEQSKVNGSSLDADGEEGQAVTAAAAVAATVATAVAAGAVMAGNEKAEAKKDGTALLKRTGIIKDKKNAIDKTKPLNKAASGVKTTSSKPTSPTKPISSPLTTARTSTPKKTAVSATLASKTATKVSAAVPGAAISRPKLGTTSPTKPLGTARPKPASIPPKTRPLTATAVKTTAVEKKPISNGEIIKITSKRSEPLASKRTLTSTAATAKVPARPASAPAARTSSTKQTAVASARTSTAISRPKATAVNGPTAKSKVSPSSSTTTRTKPTGTQTKLTNDKQVKETANKQISSHATGGTTGRSTAQKVESRMTTNGKVGVTRTVSTVRTTAGKVGTKRTSIHSTTAAKSKVVVPANDLVTEQVLATTDITICEVKSDQSLIDISQQAE